MKKRYFLLFLLLLWVFLISAGCSTDRARELMDGRVLFLGDSITQNGTYVSIIEHSYYKMFPDREFDFVSIGLSGETVSGLTEPGHNPRPWLHDRLDNALKLLPAKIVVACYGMNDGIYHPQNPERFEAYKEGILRLLGKVRETGARMIILTPPIFDPVSKAVTVGADSEIFGYQKAFKGYNDVLAEYGRWLRDLNEPDVMVVDLNEPMLAHLNLMRNTNTGYTLCPDGVHPNMTGHLIMARQFLKAVNMPVDDSDVDAAAGRLASSPLYQKVHERRNMRSYAWLAHVGFKVPRKINASPVGVAEMKADEIDSMIRAAVNRASKVKITAHRGASGLAPENTMSAMKKAIQLKAEYAELDVQETLDGELILLHDNTLNRTTDKKGSIWEMSAADLKGIDAGSWFREEFAGEPIPSLEQVMDEVRGNMMLNIELKMNGHEIMLAERVVDLIEKKNFFRHCIVTSFDREAIRMVKTLNSDIRTGYIFGSMPEENVFAGEFEILSINKRLADKGFIDQAHKHSKEVHVWTVNEPEQMFGLIAIGVDNIITDYPDRLKLVLEL